MTNQVRLKSQLAAGTADIGAGEGVPFDNFDTIELLADDDAAMSVVGNRHNLAMEDYVAKLVAAGKPLPSHPSRPRKLSIPICASEAGVSKAYLKSAAISDWLKRLIAELGVAPRPKEQNSGDVPLGAFRDKACRHYEHELRTAGKGDDVVGPALNNFKTALNFAAGPNRQEVTMPALAALQAALERAFAERPKGGKNIKADLNRAIRIHRELNKAPSTFAEVLTRGMDQVGMTRYGVAKFMDVHPSAVSKWINGDCVPDPSRKASLAELERALNLEPGSLVNRVVPYRNGIGIGRVPRTDYPQEVRGKPWLHGRIKRNLPSNYFELGPLAKHEAMQRAVATLHDMTTPERKKREEVRRKAYILKSFTPTLQGEFDDISEVFKSRKVPTRRRSQSVKIWKDVTRDTASGPALRRVFGALSCGLIHEEGKTLQIPAEHLTFALFVKPCFLRHVIAFKQKRNAGNKDHLYITRNDLALVYFAKSLCHPLTGWIKDHPDILDRLYPVPGFLTQAEIDEMRSDLAATCERAVKEYSEVIEQRRATVEPGLNSKEPVEQILRMKNPLRALKMIVDGLRLQLEAHPVNSAPAATLQRRIVMVCLFAQLALRRNTMCQIDASLHLFKEQDGQWTIKIPAEFFKNYRSTHWGSRETTNFFYRRLKDRWGFYRVLEQYLSVGRKVLLAGAKCEALFVGARGAPTLTPASLGEDFRGLTEEFLAWNESAKTGIKGVVPFGPHLVRHILATAVIKKTNGDFQAAADSIHDTIATVKKYYAVYLPGDRLERVESAVESALDDD